MLSKQIPNVITIIRILLVFPIGFTLYHEHYQVAMILFAIAGLSDGLDGLLARHFNWTTRFGAITDPLADKSLMVVTYIMLVINNHLPIWLLAVVIGRDIIIFSGAITYHFLIGSYKFNPTFISKLSTMFQIILILLLLFSLGVMSLPPTIITTGIWVVFAFSLVSGLDYVYTWGMKAHREFSKAKPS